MSRQGTAKIATDSEVERIARELLTCRRGARAIGRADAYAELRDLGLGARISARLHRLLKRQGVSVAGIKLGAATADAQRSLGLVAPLAAPIYDAWMLPTGARIQVARLVEPKLECEIGFSRAGRRWVPGACLEIADSRFQGWSGRGGQVIADFALNGAIVRGTELGRTDQASFELCHAGALVAAGRVSVATALERVAASARDSQPPYVASGSLHPLIDLQPGEWTLRFDTGGEASVIVSTEPAEGMGG